MVSGPMHRPSYLSLFSLLVDTAYKHAELRVGEPWNAKKLILIGSNPLIEQQIREAGWIILEPPWVPLSASVLIHLPMLSGNADGVDRVVQGLGVLIMRGGFFAISHLDSADYVESENFADPKVEDVIDLIMRGFRREPFNVKLNSREFNIWRKNNHWLKTAA